MNSILFAAVLSLSCSEPRQVAPWSEPRQLSTWLYEVEFSDYNDSTGLVVKAAAPVSISGGCSSCRNGNFLGRNMDWSLSRHDYFVIRTPANPAKGRHAVLGVACGAGLFSAASTNNWDYIPHFTLDGINDCGVTCNGNMVPDDYGPTTNTATGKAQLEGIHAPRYVLDYATNAQHAVALLQNRSLCANYLEFHLMICDPNETYIVEVISNKMVYKNCGYGKGEVKPVMSNFFSLRSELVGTAEGESPGAQGLERYQRALDYIERIGTFETAEDMFRCMQENWFSQSYTDPNYDNWWSEWNSYEYEDGKGEKKKFTHQDGPELRETREEFIRAYQESYKAIRKAEAETGERKVSETNFWLSSESMVYEITNKVLNARVGERDVPFVFRLGDPAFTNLTSVFVNGDNVGAATMSREPGAEWEYDAKTKTLTLLGTNNVTVSGLEGSGITLVARKGAINVPTEWIKKYYPNADMPANLVNNRAANGVYTCAESYMLGLDPTNATDVLRADIDVDAAGKVTVTFTPSAEESKAAECGYEYSIKGKEKLTDEEWLTEDEQEERGIKPYFFRVFVEPR